MKQLITLCLLALILIGGAFAQTGTECDATLKHYFGPYCINPVSSNLTGYYPVGSYVEFYRSDNSTDIGKVTGFSWQFERQAYAYYLATSPFYQIVPNGISGINEVVMPEFIFAASEAAYSGQNN